MSKTLVIYYSRSGENYSRGRIVRLARGNTERAADMIREAAGADLFRVEAVEDYPEDYRACTEQAKDELERGARPALKRSLSDLSGWDRIVVAGPCWWGTFPMALFTQLEALDFTGKKVFVLVTHEGSGFGRAERDAKRACRGAAFGEGLAVCGPDVDQSRALIEAWARRCLA
ncbi:flavodoxin [Mesosutterella sp. AGMB02718]|uniref:Flavodoxin n=1 Tax=Mesosutterella faecium TaxID=2925194 RepID=A0ABT7IPS2_9BURK|nr:flavodoxin [Mesosutterella sp. AGMB02718]MDL2059970.1 flavodoxin [Mesosutterella sp. AGMB02718]